MGRAPRRGYNAAMRGTEIFESTLQKTHLWLKDVGAELHTQDRYRSYAALRAVLHALREALPAEELAKFAAQMPLILTGVLFDGWKPHRKPVRFSRGEFYERVAELMHFQAGVEPHLAARAVLLAVGNHLSPGEIEHIQRVLPSELRELWRQVECEAEEQELSLPRRRSYESAEHDMPQPSDVPL